MIGEVPPPGQPGPTRRRRPWPGSPTLPLLPGRPPRRETPPPALLQVLPRAGRDEAGRATVDVVRAVAAAGWRALVATGGGPLERDLVMAGAEVHRLPLDAAGPLGTWRNARTLARLAWREGASLLHGRGLAAATVTAAAARRAGLPFLLTAETLPEAGGRRGGGREGGALRAAGLVVAPSEFAAERLLAGPPGVPAARVRVVPRWVDLAEFDPDRVRGHRVAAAAERCGLAVGSQVVAVPAEVAAADGRALLAGALAKVGRSDFVLLLLGPVPNGGAKRLSATLAAAGLAERVRFGTDLGDLPATLALVDVLLVPAVLPRASARLATAAQAMGKPVIVTAAGALGEAVMPAVTGWVLPPDDPAEIAWALDLALRMEDDVRERVGRRAREFAAENFAADAMLRRKLALYRELLEPATPSTPRAAARADVAEAATV